jgi:hypothetical protein
MRHVRADAFVDMGFPRQVDRRAPAKPKVDVALGITTTIIDSSIQYPGCR